MLELWRESRHGLTYYLTGIGTFFVMDVIFKFLNDNVMKFRSHSAIILSFDHIFFKKKLKYYACCYKKQMTMAQIILLITINHLILFIKNILIIYFNLFWRNNILAVHETQKYIIRIRVRKPLCGAHCRPWILSLHLLLSIGICFYYIHVYCPCDVHESKKEKRSKEIKKPKV